MPADEATMRNSNQIGSPQDDIPHQVLEVHGIKAKEKEEPATQHLRKPSNGVPLSDLQRTDAIFNSFAEQHKDWVKDPHEVKLL